MISNNELKDRIKEKGLRATFQRLLVLKILVETDSHPNAEYVTKKVQLESPSVSTGTVYHILETFVEKKIINKIGSSDNTARYDAITKQHHHIYTETDNTVTDYFDEELNELIKSYIEKKGIPEFEIKDFQVQFFGNKLSHK